MNNLIEEIERIRRGLRRELREADYTGRDEANQRQLQDGIINEWFDELLDWVDGNIQ